MKNKKGFTLIELLVAVLIIGILAAIALPQYTKSVARARVAKLKAIGKIVFDSMRIYYQTNQMYPVLFEKLDVLPQCTPRNGGSYSYCEGQDFTIGIQKSDGDNDVRYLTFYINSKRTLNRICCQNTGYYSLDINVSSSRNGGNPNYAISAGIPVCMSWDSSCQDAGFTEPDSVYIWKHYEPGSFTKL